MKRFIAWGAPLVAAAFLIVACASQAEGTRTEPDGTKTEFKFKGVFDPGGNLNPELVPWGDGKTVPGAVPFKLYDTDGDGKPDVGVDLRNGTAYKISKFEVVGGGTADGPADFSAGLGSTPTNFANVWIYESPLAAPLAGPLKSYGQTAAQLLAKRNLSTAMLATLPHDALIRSNNVIFHSFDLTTEAVKLSVHWSTALQLPDFSRHPGVGYQTHIINDGGGAHAFLQICMEGSLGDVGAVLVEMGLVNIVTRDPLGIEVELRYDDGTNTLTSSYAGAVIDVRSI